jgi:hypothetical protein
MTYLHVKHADFTFLREGLVAGMSAYYWLFAMQRCRQIVALLVWLLKIIILTEPSTLKT